MTKLSPLSAFEALEPQIVQLVVKPLLAQIIDEASKPTFEPYFDDDGKRVVWEPPTWTPALLRKLWMEKTGSKPSAARFSSWLTMAGITLTSRIIIEGLNLPTSHHHPSSRFSPDLFDNETPDDFNHPEHPPASRHPAPPDIGDVSQFPDQDYAVPGAAGLPNPGIGGIIGISSGPPKPPSNPESLSPDQVADLFSEASS